MQELKAREILDTLDKLKKHGDRLYELLSDAILEEMKTDVVLSLLTLRECFDTDHALLINSKVILKLREMVDEQEAVT